MIPPFSTLHRSFHPFLEQFPTPFILRIIGIPDLEPVLAVCPAPPLCDNSFKIALAHYLEEIASVLLYVVRQKDSWMVVNDPLQGTFPLGQRKFSEIPSIMHQAIESVEDGIATPPEEIVELGSAGSIQHDDLAVQ